MTIAAKTASTAGFLTKAAIKAWAEENRVFGYEDAYKFVERHVRNITSYSSLCYVGRPVVIPTKATACDELATFWAQHTTGNHGKSQFNQQVVYIARHLENYYQQQGA